MEAFPVVMQNPRGRSRVVEETSTRRKVSALEPFQTTSRPFRNFDGVRVQLSDAIMAFHKKSREPVMVLGISKSCVLRVRKYLKRTSNKGFEGYKKSKSPVPMLRQICRMKKASSNVSSDQSNGRNANVKTIENIQIENEYIKVCTEAEKSERVNTPSCEKREAATPGSKKIEAHLRNGA